MSQSQDEELFGRDSDNDSESEELQDNLNITHNTLYNDSDVDDKDRYSEDDYFGEDNEEYKNSLCLSFD